MQVMIIKIGMILIAHGYIKLSIPSTVHSLIYHLTVYLGH